MNKGRFWRMGAHPHGLELRSYLPVKVWIDAKKIEKALVEKEVEVIQVGQRVVEVMIRRDRFVIHGDSRIHSVAQSLESEDVRAAVQQLSDAVDDLWMVNAC